MDTHRFYRNKLINDIAKYIILYDLLVKHIVCNELELTVISSKFSLIVATNTKKKQR